MRIFGNFIDLFMVVCMAFGFGLLAKELLPTVALQSIALVVICTAFALTVKGWLAEITSQLNRA